jgi:hypothetical protein
MNHGHYRSLARIDHKRDSKRAGLFLTTSPA